MNYPLIENLPVEEQEEFEKYLSHMSRPINDDHSRGYFPWDYVRWKQSKKF